MGQGGRNDGLYRWICFPLIAMTFLIAPPSALGQEPKRIEPVVVTATRLEEPLRQVSSAVTVVTREEMEAKQLRNVEEALRSIPSVDVQRSGSLGKITTVRIRGANARQIQVLIDGVRVKSTTTGDFDFADLTLDNVERIEVVRGPQSTLYGADAIGGVINIITRKGVGRPKFSASFEAGNFETFREQVALEGAIGNADYALSFSRADFDGQFDNDQHNNTVFAGRAGFAISETARLSLTSRYSTAERGIPIRSTFPTVFDPNRGQEDDFLLLSAEFDHAITPWWDQTLRLSTLDTDLTFQDPIDPNTTATFSEIDINRQEIDWQHNFHLGNLDTATLGFELRKEDGISIGTTGLRFDKSSTIRSLFLQNQLRLFERLFLTAGIRVDDHSTFGTETTPRVAAAYLVKEIGTKIRASYGEGFRAPTFNELFFPDFGDPTLKPEESKSWEVGVEQRLFQDRIRLGVTYFRNDFKNLIQTTEVSPGVFAPQNVGRARTEGVEVEAGLDPFKGLSFIVNYTYLKPKDRIKKEELRRFARNRWNISATYRFLERWTANLTVHVVGSQFESSSVGRNPGYTRVDLAASYDVLRNFRNLETLQLFARIANLFDEDYQEVAGFPALGLHIVGGLKVRF